MWDAPCLGDSFSNREHLVSLDTDVAAASPRSSTPQVYFQHPRNLGHGYETFDSDGFPATPLLRVTSPQPILELLEPLDHLAPSAAAAGAERPRHHRTSSADGSHTSPSSKLVLVLGGTSFIAAHVTSKLLEEGYNVRLLSRECVNSDDAQRLRQSIPTTHTNSLFIMQNVEDISVALEGCDYVVLASLPKTPSVANKEETVRRYLCYVQDLFLCVKQQSPSRIKRVVMVASASSFLNVDDSSSKEEREKQVAKSIAAKEAERMALRSEIPLVLLLTSVVLGIPKATHCNDGTKFLVSLASQSSWLPCAPKLFRNMVDVKDVAAACVSALVNPHVVHQRYIISNGVFSLSEIARIVRRHFPDLKPPAYSCPNLIALLHVRLFGLYGDRLPYLYLQQNLGRRFELENTKACLDLNMHFRDMESTIVETISYALKKAPVMCPRSPTPQSECSAMSCKSDRSVRRSSHSFRGTSVLSTSRTVPASGKVAKPPNEGPTRMSRREQFLFLAAVGIVSAFVGYGIGQRISSER